MVKKMMQQYIRNTQAGVTLIEMLVVVAIIGVVSSAILFNYSDFSTNVSLRNLSQEVALSARKAQTYATSVRILGQSAVLSDTFAGYGISFAVPGSADGYSPNQKQFDLFADTGIPPNGMYEFLPAVCGDIPVSGSECIENFAINTADKIVGICINGAVYEEGRCLEDATVDITFKRPNPDALFCVHDGNAGCRTDSIGSVGIVLESAKGFTRTVTIYTTGQITAQ